MPTMQEFKDKALEIFEKARKENCSGCLGLSSVHECLIPFNYTHLELMEKSIDKIPGFYTTRYPQFIKEEILRFFFCKIANCPYKWKWYAGIKD